MMDNIFFAMDTCFLTSTGKYDLRARCEMLQDLSYDGSYLSLLKKNDWEDLPRAERVAFECGVPLQGVYYTLDVDAPGSVEEARAVIDALDTCKTVELAVASSARTYAISDPDADPAVMALLEPLIAAAEAKGITLVLYPHIGLWLERSADAVRLCKTINHPNLRASFGAFHWFAVDGTPLDKAIAEVAPHLHSVNICGCAKANDRAQILPLDQGTLDNFALLTLLAQAGYRGPIGLQGFSVGGDVYGKLKQSLDSYRSMAARVQRHPHWSPLQLA